MKRTVRVVTVFGSSRPRPGDAHYAQAQALGAALAAEGLVVCSGGYSGVMEAVSRGAKEAGGHTLAVTAAAFRGKANAWVDEEIRVQSWRERLFELVRLGRGYVACPGGTGTLVELAVVWEMLNKGLMKARPLAVLGDFWQPVIERVREVELGHASRWGEREEALVRVAASVEEAAAYLAKHVAKPAAGRRRQRGAESLLSPL